MLQWRNSPCVGVQAKQRAPEDGRTAAAQACSASYKPALARRVSRYGGVAAGPVARPVGGGVGWGWRLEPGGRRLGAAVGEDGDRRRLGWAGGGLGRSGVGNRKEDGRLVAHASGGKGDAETAAGSRSRVRRLGEMTNGPNSRGLRRVLKTFWAKFQGSPRPTWTTRWARP